MSRNQNQRIMLTKQLLQNALLELLKTKAIHSVSIRELCAEAGINRTTFYNHYGSQYDLLNDISQRFLDSVARHLSAEDTSSREEVQRRVTLVLQYFADDPELAALLLNNNVDPAFADRIFSLQQITDLLNSALPDGIDEGERAATVAFAIHGGYRLLQDWINTPDRSPAKEQAALILQLARRVCGGEGQAALPPKAFTADRQHGTIASKKCKE